MDSQLDRLIRLANKTGDRLIVHDSCTGESVVLLGLEEYEDLVSDSFPQTDIRDLSSNQLLDQINRDIAIWRSNKELEGEWDEDFDFSDESDEEDDYPMPIENNRFDDWSSASSVLDDRYDFPSEEDCNCEECECSLPEEEFNKEIRVENIPIEKSNFDEEPLNDEDPIFLEEPVF
jgi:hypothetical protein